MLNVEKLRDYFEKLNVDGLMVTEPFNRRYVSGFTGSNGVILISKNEAKLITDYRYTEQAKLQTSGFEIVLHAGHTGHKGRIFEEVASQVRSMGIKRLGFEQNHLNVGLYQKIEQLLQGVELIPTSSLIEDMRLIKTEEEIRLLKTSAEITNAAFDYVLDYVKPGVTEMEICNHLELFIRKEGALTSTFMPIVASGYRSALPHGRASNKVIEKGDFVTIDFGCNYHGYWSDISRTVAIGEPVAELKKVYDVVHEAFQQCLNNLRPGLTDQEVDSFMREPIKRNGYNDLSGTGTGHGIGLEVHELPLFSVLKDKILQSNMVITIEPGIYIPNLGGARIEDVILITETGCEVLTPSSKELLIL